MDLLVEKVTLGKNVVVTALQGAARSRFLLKSELSLLGPGPARAIRRVYHVVDSGRLVEKVYAQAVQMPFRELGITVSKEGDDFGSGQAPDQEYGLFVCSLECILNKYPNDDNTTQTGPSDHDLVVFDGITLENLEGSCCEAIPAGENNPTGPRLPSVTFDKIRRRCFVLACNPPVDGLGAELGADIEHLSIDLTKKESYLKKARLLARDQTGQPFRFGGLDYQGGTRDLYRETGDILKSLALDGKSDKIVVFFPSYGKMVEYHNAWKQLGIFNQTEMAYGRENRAGDQFKNSLVQFLNEKRFTLLCSIRYHKEEDLAEFCMAQASAVMVVGLPYPFMNDTWEERIRYNNEHLGASDRLSGQSLHKFRAIEFLNGIVKRCLNEYRYRDAHVVILDEALEGHCDKLAAELGNVEFGNKV